MMPVLTGEPMDLTVTAHTDVVAMVIGASDVVGIATERFGIAIDVSDSAPHLLDHGNETAARIVHIDEGAPAPARH